MKRLMILALLLPGAAMAHGGHTSPLPWDACEDQSLGEICQFETSSHELHIGTCRSMSGDLMCVRNRPIVAAGATTHEDRLPAAGATLAAIGVVGGLILPVLVRRRFHRPARLDTEPTTQRTMS